MGNDELLRSSKENLHIIATKEPEFFVQLASTIKAFAEVYNEKYEAVQNDYIVSKNVLYHKDFGLGACLHNATKYIQRFVTTGFDKSRNPTDIIKAIHYLLFMLVQNKRLEK